MSVREYAKYASLSKAGQTEYGRERAVEADADGGKWPKTLAKMYAGGFDKI